MDYELRSEYWKDPRAKAAFKDFILKIHGLDFSTWDQAGFWDEAYPPFSYFMDDELVANVCVYLLDAIIDGRQTKLAQISGVGTYIDHRRKGLSRRLTEIGLEWAKEKHEGVFLFADTDAITYYEKTGFQPIEEYLEVTRATPTPMRKGAVRLDPDNHDHLAKIHNYAKNRVPVSDHFSVGSEKLTMFHVLYTMRNVIYEIPKLNCLVFCKRSVDRLSVFDVVGERIPNWNEIYPFIADPCDENVEFHFYTDKLNVEGAALKTLGGNLPFIKGAFLVEKPVFPFTCRA